MSDSIQNTNLFQYRQNVPEDLVLAALRHNPKIDTGYESPGCYFTHSEKECEDTKCPHNTPNVEKNQSNAQVVKIETDDIGYLSNSYLSDDNNQRQMNTVDDKSKSIVQQDTIKIMPDNEKEQVYSVGINHKKEEHDDKHYECDDESDETSGSEGEQEINSAEEEEEEEIDLNDPAMVIEEEDKDYSSHEGYDEQLDKGVKESVFARFSKNGSLYYFKLPEDSKNYDKHFGYNWRYELQVMSRTSKRIIMKTQDPRLFYSRF